LFCLLFGARLGNYSPVAHATHAKVVMSMRALLTAFVN
jgi:hypothetical protein